MKRLLTLFAAISMLFVAGCGGDDYDDTAIRNEITDLANRVAKLEQLCQQMNTNISSLQTIVNALQQNDFITAVVPVTQGGKVIGYTITFSRSGAITIYHGTDGADGKDGKDGSTPQVSVKKDTDGIYYWTLNGEWLTDEAGNKIQAEGKDGANGSNGNDGADGITPQLKIEENYWYISYDNGATWTQLGKAVGEDGADGSDGSDGKDGMDGEDGDSIFSGVSQDDEFVYFHLSDGTMITLPKHDKENIQFEDLNVKAICCKNWDTNNDGELSYDEAAAVTDLGTTFKGNTNIIAFNELKYFTGLTTIANSAFEGCTNLWKVQLPNTVETIGDNAFKGCTGLIGILFPESVTTIGQSAFEGCSSIKDLALPNSIIAIGKRAFSGCSALRNINIPESITIIEEAMFSGCSSLTRLIVPEGVTSIGHYAFDACGGVISIPKTVTTFGSDICVGCTGELIVDCDIPDGEVVNSSYYIFDGVFTSSATKVTIGENVTTIGKYAFVNNGSLQVIEIGSNVTSIGHYAFLQKSSKENLTSVYVKATTPPTLSLNVFDYVDVPYASLESFTIPVNLTIYVPRGSEYAYKSKWSRYSSRIVGYDFEE